MRRARELAGAVVGLALLAFDRWWDSRTGGRNG